MDIPRDEATEVMLGDIITKGSDVVALFLNDTEVWKDGVVKKAMIMMAPMTH